MYKSVETAYARAAAACARREYCRADWLRKLAAGGLEDTVCRQVVERLVSEGFIDELRYARAFVHDKAAYNRWGMLKIKQALRLKGLSAEVVETALGTLETENSEQTLRELLQAKMRDIRAASAYELRGKLMRFAAGRGFEPDCIFRVIDELEIPGYGED